MSDNKWIGYKFIKRSNDIGGTLMEIWKDQGDNQDSTNNSQWVRIGQWNETNNNWRQPPNDHIDPPIYSRVGTRVVLNENIDENKIVGVYLGTAEEMNNKKKMEEGIDVFSISEQLKEDA